LDSEDVWDSDAKAKEFLDGEETDENYGLSGVDDDSLALSDQTYEFNAGEMNLYDSRIDNVDELKTLKDTLLYLSQND